MTEKVAPKYKEKKLVLSDNLFSKSFDSQVLNSQIDKKKMAKKKKERSEKYIEKEKKHRKEKEREKKHKKEKKNKVKKRDRGENNEEKSMTAILSDLLTSEHSGSSKVSFPNKLQGVPFYFCILWAVDVTII